MRNQDGYLLWEHISKAYYEDVGGELRSLPKIRMEHIKMTSYSSMKVYLAAQVLSSTMSAALTLFGGEECAATAKYCKIIDSFFDCFNVRSVNEGKFKSKPNSSPFKSTDDGRFDWLINTFLAYFDNWKQFIDNQAGEFTQADRARMFISWQTYEGLHITTKSIIEVTKFLINEGAEFVLTERFCQDTVEQYFGNQRKFGRRNENPDLYEAGYFDNTIRIQKTISCSTGNTSGRYDSKKNWINVSDTKISKRK